MNVLTPLRLLVPLLLTCGFLVAAQDSRPVRSTPPAGESPVTVILIRHAEKANAHTRDPELTEAGVARAESLAALLKAAEVSHLFSTEYKRTRDTLAPLAAQNELEVQVVSASEPFKLVQSLRELPPGSTAVVSGHSNTTPALASALGLDLPNLKETDRGPMLRENEYDRLFLLTLPPNGAKGVQGKVVELRYGP